jgi:hypothetical protein
MPVGSPTDDACSRSPSAPLVAFLLRRRPLEYRDSLIMLSDGQMVACVEIDHTIRFGADVQ